MEAYSLDAVDFAREHFGVHLDYSLESLRELDTILQRFHDDLPKGLSKAFKRGPSEEQVAQHAKTWGGYLGEVIRRRWGGTWVLPEEGPFAGAICLEVGDTLISPPSRTAKRMMNGPEDSVYDYASVLAAEFGSTSRSEP